MSEELRKILQEEAPHYYALCDNINCFLSSFNIEEILSIIVDCAGEKCISIAWNSVSVHPKLTTELVEQYIDEPWAWNLLAIHPCISLELVFRHPKKNWNWMILSRHSGLTEEFVNEHPNIPWDREFISQKFSNEL
jgi:hypothetical protein